MPCGKSHGRRSLEGCSPWGCWGLDTTERLPFHFHFHALEKEMATHSSVLAWRIPGTGEPGGLPPMGSHRVGHDWSDLAAVVACPEMLSFTSDLSNAYIMILKSESHGNLVVNALPPCIRRLGFSNFDKESAFFYQPCWWFGGMSKPETQQVRAISV